MGIICTKGRFALRQAMRRCFLYFLYTCFRLQVQRKLRVSRGKYPLCSGFPIGASSTPVGTRFSVGKSSVLYLCFRLMPGRGCLRHLQPGQMGSGQTLFGGSRAGGFCTIADETGICTQGKIRLTEKGSKGISTPRPAAATAH